jgi:hypothetical protein
MIRNIRMIRRVASRISKAAELAGNDLSENLVEQEPHFTDRLLGRIAQSIDGYKTKGVTWKAKTLTDRGPGAQEKRYGADFIGVLNIELATYSVKKGFLAQAKLLDQSGTMSAAEWKRMRKHCNDMLGVSSDSFIFVYSNESIRVIPAIVVLGATESRESFSPETFYSRSLARFFEEHFACFIGDHRISEPTIETLESLHARRLLVLSATQSV